MNLKTPKAHGVTFNFIMNMILTISSFVFPLITFPYISRVLGAEGNGKVEFAASVISYFSMFAQLGIPTYGIRVCAQCRNDKEKLNRTVQELLIINTGLICITYFLFFVCLMLVPRLQEEKTMLIITSLSIVLNSFGVNWLFSAFEQYGYITTRNLIFKIISIVLMFLLVKSKEHYVIYGAINVFATSGSNVLNIIYARRFLDHRIFKDYQFKRHLRPILTFFMLSVAVTIYTGMDKVMIGFMCDDAEVGYYSAAVKMKSILVSAVTALGTVLLPRISNVFAEGNMREYKRLIQKSINFIFVCAVPLTVYFAWMADSTILFLAGKGYEEAVLPMRIITPTILLIGLSNITGMQVLVPTNRENITTFSTIVGAIVNLALNTILIKDYGAIGAAIGTLTAEFAVLVCQIVFLHSEIWDFIRGIQIGRIFLSNAIAILVLCLAKTYAGQYSYFGQLLICAIMFFFSYGFLLITFHEKFTCQYMEWLKKYFVRRFCRR